MPATADARSPRIPLRSRHEVDPVRHARRWMTLRQARGRLLALSDVESIASCGALETMRLVGAGAGAVTWLGQDDHAGARLSLVSARPSASDGDDEFPNVVAAPIRHRGHVVGVLEAMDPPVGGFPPDAHDTLDALAAAIALAYERIAQPSRTADPALGGHVVGLTIAVVGPVAIAHAVWGEAAAGLCGLCAFVGIAVASAAARTAVAPRAASAPRPWPIERGGVPRAGG